MNPEIEEKLLTLQRYQEKQAKGEPFDPTSFVTAYPTRGTGRTKTNVTYDSPQDSDDSECLSDNSEVKAPARRRGANLEDDDDEWVLDTPRKYIKKADREKLERSIKKEPLDVSKKIVQEKETKIIVKTSDTGQIRKNIIFCNRMDNDSNVQNNFSLSSGNDGSENEKRPEKALIASKLKMKAAQKVGITDDQFKHHKLQVILFLCRLIIFLSIPPVFFFS